LSVPKIVIHTDVFLNHLCGAEKPSVLRQAMSKFFCYTTVFQAIELFSLARTEREFQAVEDAMAAMKLLGLNPKNARKYGELLASNRKVDSWNILIAGLCLESRLPLLTDRKRDFGGLKDLVIVPTKLVGLRNSAEEILRAVQQRSLSLREAS
jgi:predicted nucleic acid-binding protein